MKCYLCKSLSKNLSDNDIENGYYPSKGFISFGSIIKLVLGDYYDKKVIGYKVIEQGIEILYK